MERVVVTGIGLITPNGVGTSQTWESLVRGESGVGPITLFDADERYPSRIAAEVKGFDPATYMPRKKLKEVSRFIPFSMGATQLALDEADLNLSDEERERVGVFIGVGLGGLENLERCTLTVAQRGPGKVSPYFIPSLIANMASGQISIQHGFQGPVFAHTSACSSSAHALGEALRWMQSGRTEVMVTGGAEATISPIGIGGFSAMFALSRRNEEPEKASRPWDKARDGFVCGEGAGTVILESLTRAKRRGANILAELVGYGATSDAYHITKPAPGGKGGARAMREALRDASLDPSAIDYVNAHGTSTPAGDVEEARAITTVFGQHALDKKLWVSSTKSMMGHLLGAAGAVESAICIKALNTSVVPPTINLEDQDDECQLDCVPLVARERPLKYAMTNSFGFGGTNATLIFSKYDG